jgi:hypothetical protein
MPPGIVEKATVYPELQGVVDVGRLIVVRRPRRPGGSEGHIPQLLQVSATLYRSSGPGTQ